MNRTDDLGIPPIIPPSHSQLNINPSSCSVGPTDIYTQGLSKTNHPATPDQNQNVDDKSAVLGGSGGNSSGTEQASPSKSYTNKILVIPNQDLCGAAV